MRVEIAPAQLYVYPVLVASGTIEDVFVLRQNK